MVFSQETNTEEKKGTVYLGLFQSFTINNDGTYIYKERPESYDISQLPTSDYIISYGRYVKYRNKAYYLFSDTNLLYCSDLKLNVEESFIKNKKGIAITITNPYEKAVLVDTYKRNSFYRITVYYDGDSIRKKNINCISYVTYSNQLEIPDSDSKNIDKIEVFIYPLIIGYGASFAKGNYILKNKNSNILHIDIPQFTYDYLFYKRYLYDFIEIIDKNTIGFDGKIFVKSDMYKKKKYYIYDHPRERKKNWRYIRPVFSPYY